MQIRFFSAASGGDPRNTLFQGRWEMKIRFFRPPPAATPEIPFFKVVWGWKYDFFSRLQRRPPKYPFSRLFRDGNTIFSAASGGNPRNTFFRISNPEIAFSGFQNPEIFFFQGCLGMEIRFFSAASGGDPRNTLFRISNPRNTLFRDLKTPEINQTQTTFLTGTWTHLQPSTKPISTISL